MQYTQQEEYVMHQRCLGRWTARNEKHLKSRIEDFIGYPVESINYEEKKNNKNDNQSHEEVINILSTCQLSDPEFARDVMKMQLKGSQIPLYDS